VYLGEEADDSGKALNILEKISQTDFRSKGITAFMRDEELGSVELPSPGDVVWTALRKFWCRPWSRRIWVVQEFVL
jgi:hypothetical protein